MPRMIAYLCNDDNLTPVAVRSVQASVDLPATAQSGGFGFGWLQEGRSLLRTTPKPAPGSPALLDLMADIRSRAIVAHVRDAADGEAETLDLQPFRFRQWVVAHAGEDVGHPQTRQQLLSGVPDFVAANVKGTSASEIFGHMFLGQLHRAGLLDGPVDAARCAGALAQMLRDVQVEAAVGQIAALAVTDRALVAGSIGRPLYYREIRGLSQVREEPLFAGHKPRPTVHPTFKGVFVTDAPVEGEEWRVVPDGHVMWVDRQWAVRFAPVAG